MKLTDKEHLQLLMADAAYQNADARATLKRKGWKRDARFGNAETSVFVHGRHVVIAFRGTNLTKKDIKADVATDVKAVATGNAKQDRRFLEAQQVVKQVRKALPGVHIQVTGHSLGGTIAQYIGRLFCFPGTSFNPGSSPVGNITKVMKEAARIGRKLRKHGSCTKVKIIRIATKGKRLATDPISINARDNFPGSKDKQFEAETSIKTLGFAHHGLGNFYSRR